MAVYLDMTVQYKLPGGTTRWGKTKTIHKIIKPHFQQLQQLFAGYAPAFQSSMEKEAELRFLHSVGTAQLLFLTQLDTVVRRFAAALTMHARRRMTLFNRTFRHVTTIALQEKFRSFATALFASWTCIPTHKIPLFPDK